MNTLNNATRPNCPVCSTDVESTDTHYACPSCAITFHDECWRENQGCTTYGCPKVGALKPPPIQIMPGPVHAASNTGWAPIPSQNTGSLPRPVASHGMPPSFAQPGPMVSPFPPQGPPYGQGFAPNNTGTGYFDVLRKYAQFSGRARRQEYWMFSLVNGLINVALTIAGTSIGIGDTLASIYGLAVLIPSLAVCVRRLHDVGKSGWMMLIVLIPLIGAIYLLILSIRDSQPGDNQYGPNPKGVR